jgi:hypothetical protein
MRGWKRSRQFARVRALLAPPAWCETAVPTSVILGLDCAERRAARQPTVLRGLRACRPSARCPCQMPECLKMRVPVRTVGRNATPRCRRMLAPLVMQRSALTVEGLTHAPTRPAALTVVAERTRCAVTPILTWGPRWTARATSHAVVVRKTSRSLECYSCLRGGWCGGVCVVGRGRDRLRPPVTDLGASRC